MKIKFDKETKDSRGKLFHFSYDHTQIVLAEVKKGQARGGHYHKTASINYCIIEGEVEYHETNIKTGEETISIYNPLSTIMIPIDTAHLLIALKDTIFIEFSKGRTDAILFPKYRKVVEERLKNKPVPS